MIKEARWHIKFLDTYPNTWETITKSRLGNRLYWDYVVSDLIKNYKRAFHSSVTYNGCNALSKSRSLHNQIKVALANRANYKYYVELK